MRPPKTIASLCAYMFGLMGTLFTLLGIVFYCVGIPVEGGPNWAFILVGGSLLLAGLGCLLKHRRQERRRARLKKEGVRAAATIQSVRHYVWINWNTRSFVTQPGQCSPWVIQCSYRYREQTYTVKSPLCWQKPASQYQQPVVYLDPDHPNRACLDMDTIRWEFSPDFP